MSELSERAQQMIDEARKERSDSPPAVSVAASIESLLSEPVADPLSGFISKSQARATAPRKPQYTAEAMVDLMIAHPEYSHSDFAAHFGYKASWFAGILISNNFQAALEPRRHLVQNPMLTGTMDDILRAVVVQSVTVLQERLEDPKASEDLIIKALNAGVKALGMGTGKGEGNEPPPEKPTLAGLADRLSKPKLIEATPAHDWTIEASLGELPK